MGGKMGVRRGQGQAPRTGGAQEPAAKAAQPMRIAKAIAHAGLCSRRDAEAWIAAGRVAVNGKVLTTPAHVVSPDDTIMVDGKPLPEKQGARLWRYHKRRGLVTSHKDPQGRKTVFEVLPPELPRVVSVGRLDINTEGLLLLTTDGELARHLELPSTGWLRRYRVRAHGRVTQDALDRLRQGLTLDGIQYGPVESVAHHFVARRQEPRGEADRRASRLDRQPADPRVVRAVRARRSARRCGRGGEAARAGRSIGREARRSIRTGCAGKIAPPGAPQMTRCAS